MAVPNIFGSATSAIPLSQLDQNFATAITLGNTAVYLGNTTTSLGNVTLTNVTISSGNVSVSTATVGAGSNTAPSITTTGDTNTGIFFPAADTIAFTEGGTEAMRLDSGGNMGLGVTPSATWSSSARAIQLGGFNSIFGYTSNVFRLANNAIFTAANETYGASSIGATYYQQYNGAHSWYNAASGTAGNAISFTQAMTLDASGNLLVGGTSNAVGARMLSENASGNQLGLRYTGVATYYNSVDSSGNLIWTKDGTERARIDSSGNLLVGLTSVNFGTAGISLRPAADSHFTRDSGNVIAVNRLTNDGNLVEFAQASTVEGIISVSGTTVTYGGGHLARFGQLPDGLDDLTLLKGTVLTNLDEMCVWINKETGVPADNEQCNKVKISDVDGDANVAGVFVSWSYDEQHDTNDLFVAMTGDMIIRIAQGTTVQRGDLLMSAGDGTAKPQGDDIVRSKTVAKVTSTHVTCTYADGSFCVPCVLMAC